MKRIKLALLVTVLSSLLVAGSLGLSVYLNSVAFHYSIGPVGSMSSSLIIDMNADNGFIAVNSSGGSNGSLGVGSPVDQHNNLILNVRANVTFGFRNMTELEPFTAFQCIILLYNDSIPYNEVSLDKNAPLSSIIVLPGTFDLWTAYTYTAGPSNATGTIMLDVSALPA